MYALFAFQDHFELKMFLEDKIQVYFYTRTSISSEPMYDEMVECTMSRMSKWTSISFIRVFDDNLLTERKSEWRVIASNPLAEDGTRMMMMLMMRMMIIQRYKASYLIIPSRTRLYVSTDKFRKMLE